MGFWFKEQIDRKKRPKTENFGDEKFSLALLEWRRVYKGKRGESGGDLLSR